MLAVKIFRNVNDINPNYMKKIFILKVNPRISSNDNLFRSNDSLFRSNDNLFGSNDNLFRSNDNLFRSNDNLFRSNDNLFRHHKTASYVNKSLAALGPQIWNKLLSNIKGETSLKKFKEYRRT